MKSQNRTVGNSGYTLLELLVVITIIVVLALLIIAGAQRGMLMAAKSRTISQMREIGVAVGAWAGEHNNNEPMYFRDWTGDSSSEATPAPRGIHRHICAGNPAILLYNKANPSDGYIQDHTVFFAPIQKWDVPEKKDYDPSQAKSSPATLWGTFIWVYPSVPDAERTPRQKEFMRSSSYVTVSRAAYDNCLMFNDYSRAKPKYSKKDIYFALFRDGSVRHVADSGGQVWKWFYGK